MHPPPCISVAPSRPAFPEAARGSGEGNYPWDLEPGSMMTNATISGAVEKSSGREFSLTYKDGTQTVTVPPEVSMWIEFASAVACLWRAALIFSFTSPADVCGLRVTEFDTPTTPAK